MRNRLFGLSNANWMVSENHACSPASVRQPPACCQVSPSHRSQFMAVAFFTNSGFRTRYPYGAVDTKCPTYQKRTGPGRWVRQNLYV